MLIYQPGKLGWMLGVFPTRHSGTPAQCDDLFQDLPWLKSLKVVSVVFLGLCYPEKRVRYILVGGIPL